MTRQPTSALPSSTTLSSLYGRSVTTSLCQCGRRWECMECRSYWVKRRKESSGKWLTDAMGNDGLAWFVTLTIPTAGEWVSESAELFDRWSKLGKQRSQQRFRGTQHGLGSIRRGLGALHLVNRRGHYQPHLHGLLVSDSTCISEAVANAWNRMGPGYVEIELARKKAAVEGYSIAGPLPSEASERKAIASMLKGIRVIRRIGR